MRVAMVGAFPLPGHPPTGGIEGVTSAIAEGIRAAGGVDLSIVTCTTEVSEPTRSVREDLDMWLVPFRPARGRGRPYQRETRMIRSALARIQPDLVHVQGQNFVGPAALGAGVPSVVTLHGILWKEARLPAPPEAAALERARRRFHGWLNARYERRTLAMATDLIIISPYVLRSVEHMTSATPHLIPNPIDERFFAIARRPVPGRILFAGVLTPRKNVLPLVRAFAQVRARRPDASLHLVGRAVDQPYHRAILDAIAERGLGDAVSHLGVVSDEAMDAEYAEASVLVLPSREESSPLVIQQAMAAGLPVVASRAGGIPDLVAEGRTGLLVPPGEPGPLAEVLLRVIEDDGLRGRMAEAARSEAAAFNPRAVAERTIDVYSRVAGRRAADVAAAV